MASLQVLGGGQVTIPDSVAGRGAIAVAADSVGAVVVDGAGSLLDAGAFLGAGTTFDGTDSGGAALLNVRNGAVVRAAEVAIGSNGALTGDGTVQGNVTATGGAVQPGNSPGILTIDGDFTFVTGVLEIEIASLDPGEFDVIEATGAANLLGGPVQVPRRLPARGRLYPSAGSGRRRRPRTDA